MSSFNTIEYLKNPELVATIQNHFGIRNLSKTSNSGVTVQSTKKECNFEITNKFWYYVFSFGTALGDEIFYSSFIPFWFWNIDGAVGRRVVLVWALVMYIGQGMKDILQWPRPGSPVVRLHDKWALEYGMPSTHAMVGVSIPFSILIYTMDRYQYNVPLCLSGAVLWCSIICLSRLYLGMHTVLDIIVGLFLAVLFMIPLVPIVDSVDSYLISNTTAPLLLVVSSILMIVYYPNSGKWTPTRGDTSMVLSVCVGVLVGSWLNYQTGEMSPAELTPPYPIMWPSLTMFACVILRTVIGFSLVLIGMTISKGLSYSLFCALLREDVTNLKQSANSLTNKHKTIVELGCKYITCALLGFNTVYLIPQIFKFLRIERHTFFTEM